MYHCISLSRKYPKGNVAEKELHHEGREESLKEAFVIIVIIINGKEFGRTHQFLGNTVEPLVAVDLHLHFHHTVQPVKVHQIYIGTMGISKPTCG